MAGRRSKFTPELQAKALTLYEAGKTDKQVARAVGVSLRTIHNYKAANSAFLHSIKGAKAVADELVESALFRRAMGYTYEAEKVFCYQGEVIRVETIKHLPPDPSSMIFWLCNRRPDRWRR